MRLNNCNFVTNTCCCLENICKISFNIFIIKSLYVDC